MNGQSIAELMGNLQGDDWGSVDGLMNKFSADPKAKEKASQENRENQRRRTQYLAALATVFSSEEGQLVLDELLNGTVRRIKFHTQLGIDPWQSHAYGCYREGQNSVVAMILKDLAEVGGGVAPEKENDDGWRSRVRAGSEQLRKPRKRRWWFW
ncbi:hypothetical protein [Pseudovibrio denitrificans]|uniref:Bbp19 family protein n=1 Tax=Pseudovibrio denitrificans TaxID=258256 RepID=UPI0006CF5F63|nr:hypothetical protein [Pseudovibrio denitrificans]